MYNKCYEKSRKIHYKNIVTKILKNIYKWEEYIRV